MSSMAALERRNNSDDGVVIAELVPDPRTVAAALRHPLPWAALLLILALQGKHQGVPLLVEVEALRLPQVEGSTQHSNRCRLARKTGVLFRTSTFVRSSMYSRIRRPAI